MFNPGDTAYLANPVYNYTGKVTVNEVVTITTQTRMYQNTKIQYEISIPNSYVSVYVEEADLTAYRDRYFILLADFPNKKQYAQALFKGNIHYWTEEQEEFVLNMHERVTQDFITIVAAFEAHFGITRSVGAISSRLEKIK